MPGHLLQSLRADPTTIPDGDPFGVTQVDRSGGEKFEYHEVFGGAGAQADTAREVEYAHRQSSGIVECVSELFHNLHIVRNAHFFPANGGEFGIRVFSGFHPAAHVGGSGGKHRFIIAP